MRGWRSARSRTKNAVAPTAEFVIAPPPRLGVPVGPPPAPPSAAEAAPNASAAASAPPEPVAAEPPAAPPAAAEPAAPVVAPLEMQSEFLRLLAVVTSMCDHVIEYIEADRAERRLMVETLAQLSRTITEGAAATLAAGASSPPSAPAVASQRLIGGSMAAGPEPVIDLIRPQPEPEWQLDAEIDHHEHHRNGTPVIEIAVEVRGRFGDRWVDGFEICEVISTAAGTRYRLRRQRDGVVLPELFDATRIRHVETFEQLNGNEINGSADYWSRS